MAAPSASTAAVVAAAVAAGAAVADDSRPLTTPQVERLAAAWLANEAALRPYRDDPETWETLSSVSNFPITGSSKYHPLNADGERTNLREGIFWLVGKALRQFYWHKRERRMVGFAFFLSSAQGPPSAAHGGCVFTTMDDLFGVCSVNLELGGPAFTASLNVNLRSPCPLLTTVKCIGEPPRVERRPGKATKIHHRGRMEMLDGTLIAQGTSLFIKPAARSDYKPAEVTAELIAGVHRVRSSNLAPFVVPGPAGGGGGGHFVQLPRPSRARRQWIAGELREPLRGLLADPDVWQSARGSSDGYCGDPTRPQRHILMGCLDGKMLHLVLFNSRTRLTMAFVKFLPVAEGPPGLAQGGAIGTAVDETLFTWYNDNDEDRPQEQDLSKFAQRFGDVPAEEQRSSYNSATAALNVNYKQGVPLNETVVIETSVERIEASSDGKKAKCFLSFTVRSLDRRTLYNDGTALLVTDKPAVMALTAASPPPPSRASPRPRGSSKL